MSEEKTSPWVRIAEEWRVYWRGALVLSIALGALLVPVIPKRTPSAFLSAIGMFGFMNFVLYPYFLLTRSIWRSSPVLFILYTIVLSITPLLTALWIQLMLVLSRHVLQAHRFFKFEFPAALLLFGAAVWLSPDPSANASTDENPPAEASASAASDVNPEPKTKLKKNLNKIAETATEARSAFTGDDQIAPPPSSTPEAETIEPAPPPQSTTAYTEYKDPKGYYTVRLPDGFTIEDKSTGTRSKRAFNYSPRLSIWFIASKMPRPWDPEKSMNEKMEGINSGRAGFPRGTRVVQNRLIEIDRAEGYEFAVESGTEQYPTYAHSLALVKEGTSLSIAITCNGEQDRPLFEIVKNSILESLTIESQASESSRATYTPSRSVPTAAPPDHAVPMDKWEMAQSSIRITGVMNRGGKRLILVGQNIYEEGDTLTTEFRGQLYSFIVKSIGEQREQVVLEPVRSD